MLSFFRNFFGGSVRDVGQAAADIGRVFVGDKAARSAQKSSEFLAALGQFRAEYARAPRGGFSAFVDGINRLPRPLMAFGVFSLFIYAFADPVNFSKRMQAIALIPDQMWWLLGAVVGFYFGARELHYLRRDASPIKPSEVKAALDNIGRIGAIEHDQSPEKAPSGRKNVALVDFDQGIDNKALLDWRAQYQKSDIEV